MPTTTLSKSPGLSFYNDGMHLGDGIDAITGDVSQSALDSDFTVRNGSSTQSCETGYFRMVADVSELENSSALGLSGSLTFPAEGLNITAQNTLDFTRSEQSSSYVVLIVFDWEARSGGEQVAHAKLSADAQVQLAEDKDTFREKYGDYYILQITHLMQFTAIWKCTSANSSDISAFKQEISGSINAKEMEADGNFTAEIKKVATKHNVTVDVQYEVVGDTGDKRYDTGDVRKTFNSFRQVAKPLPYEILLQHYSVVDYRVLNTIRMDPDVFCRICNVYATARFDLLMNGVIPGTRTARLARRNKLDQIFREIQAKRLSFEGDPKALDAAIKELDELNAKVWLLLARQDLVMSQHALTYDDMKRNFNIDHENSYGNGCAWIHASKGVSNYVLGRTGFSADEKRKYAIQSAMVAEVHLDGKLFQQQVDAFGFPGASGINGYVVGMVVEDCWKDGTDGWWGILKDLSLGTKEAKVGVKTEGSRGMHWRLTAYYIPSSEYDECQ